MTVELLVSSWWQVVPSANGVMWPEGGQAAKVKLKEVDIEVRE